MNIQMNKLYVELFLLVAQMQNKMEKKTKNEWKKMSTERIYLRISIFKYYEKKKCLDNVLEETFGIVETEKISKCLN